MRLACLLVHHLPTRVEALSDPDAVTRRASRSVHQQQEHSMGEIIDKIKGKAKQVKGDLTDDSALHAEGVVDELKPAEHKKKRRRRRTECRQATARQA